MPFVEIPGLRVHYRQEGTGDVPVVFLHGFPQTSYQWRHQLAALSSAGYACFAPDNRGFGETDKPDLRISRGLLARDVVRFLDAVGLESAHLVTHDWGGIIGFKVVADHPERVRSIALLDTLCTVWPPRGQHGYWFKAEGLAEEFFANYHSIWIEATFAGRDGADLPGAPAAPWGFRPGPRPRPTWIDDDALEHYRRAFSDPGCVGRGDPVLPLRPAVPRDRRRRTNPTSCPNARWRRCGCTPAASPRTPSAASTWTSAPRTGRPASNGPRCGCTATTWGGAPVRVERPSGRRPAGRAPRASTPSPRSSVGTSRDLRTQAVDAGHFLGEEAAPVVTEALLRFLPEPRR